MMKKQGSANRWKIIAIVSIFNILAEYSLRGINDLRVHAPLFPILILIYLSYFIMIEDLITRFRLSLRQLFIISFSYALLWQILFPLGIMAPPLVLGINWGAFLFVNVVFWCSIQTILGFYVATRLVPRDWDHPLLSRTGFAISLMVFCLSTLAIRFNVPGMANPAGTLILTLLMLVSYRLFRKSLTADNNKTAPPPPYLKSAFLDVLSAGLVLLFIVMALFLTPDPATFEGVHIFNRTAVRVVSAFATFVTAAMWAYRYLSKTKKPFSI